MIVRSFIYIKLKVQIRIYVFSAYAMNNIFINMRDEFYFIASNNFVDIRQIAMINVTSAKAVVKQTQQLPGITSSKAMVKQTQQ